VARRRSAQSSLRTSTITLACLAHRTDRPP